MTWTQPHRDALSPTRAAVLFAVIASTPRATVRSVAADVGVSTTTAYHHLRRLRADGFVAWVPGRAATLHATVTTTTPARRTPCTPDGAAP